MNELIKNIVIKNNLTIENKNAELDKLTEDIEKAKGLLSGKYAYCKNCDDLYLSKSFFNEYETEEIRFCTYSDPINSGGDEYVVGYVDITYKICPKGHRHEINRIERQK